MRIKKGTPGKGDQPRAEQFSNVKVPPSTKTWDAWCAGDPYWCVAHEHTDAEPGTKICLQWATDGAVKCPRCRPKGKPRSWVAYVPLYRDLDNKAVMVICHETVRDLLDNLFFGVAVMVGRIEKSASIFVKRSVIEKRYTSSMPTRQAACDLSDTLLNIWGYPQYVEWIEEQERREKSESNARKVPRLKPLRSDGHPFSPAYVAAANRYGSNDHEQLGHAEQLPAATEGGSGDVDDALRAAITRAKRPSKNGHHEPDGGNQS